jgi:hypothetical protein
MSRRSALAATLLAVVPLAGCAGLEDATRDVAGEVRSQAEGRVDEAMQDRLADVRERFGGAVDVDRVCALVADDRLSAGERGRLEVAVELGEALGLPAEVTTAARTVLDATDGATTRVDDLSRACAEVGARLEGTSAPSPDTR